MILKKNLSIVYENVYGIHDLILVLFNLLTDRRAWWEEKTSRS